MNATSPVEHYDLARDHLKDAETNHGNPTQQMADLMAAQVHATLALAAVTALSSQTLPLTEHAAWLYATGAASDG